MSFSILPTAGKPRTGFFASQSDSDSDSDSDSKKKVVSPKDTSKLFKTYLAEELKFKKPKLSIAEDFRAYLKDTCKGAASHSPTAVFQKYIEKTASDELSFSKVNMDIMEGYVSGVALAPDSPTRQLRSLRKHEALNVFSKKLSLAPPDTPQYHREALETFRGVPTFSATIQALKSVPCLHRHTALPPFPPIINIVHIVEGEVDGIRSRGYHFSLNNSIAVTVRARNPITGVFFGRFKLGDGIAEKDSTFFPPSVDSETALVKVIQDAEKIAQQDNRFLYRTRTDIPFYMEKLFQDDGCVIQSAYPLFSYEDFTVGRTFQITEVSALESTEILSALSSLPIVQKHTRYELGDTVIVDIAPLFQDKTGLSQGIDFRFPRGVFPF